VHLLAALEYKRAVRVVLRGATSSASPPREFDGRPIDFQTTPDGRERVVLEIVHGEVEQIVLVDRIVQVIDLDPERTG
jgi:hypothetical protein